MRRALTAFLLSLITFSGGHVYNGRWAKATLFGVLALAVMAAAGTAMALGYFERVELVRLTYYDTLEAIGAFGSLAVLFVVALLALAFVSAAVAAHDARKRPSEEESEGRMSRWLATAAMSLFGFCILAAPFVYWVASMSEDEPEPKTLSSGYTTFSHTLSGDNIVSSTGTLTGLALDRGKPAAGLKFRLSWESKPTTDWITAGNDGRFTCILPTGSYLLRELSVDTETADIIFQKGSSNDFLPVEQGRYEYVFIRPWAESSSLTLEFVAPVERVRPAGGEEVAADVVFEWKPYPGARYYRVTLFRHETSPETAGRKMFTFYRPKFSGTTTTARLVGSVLQPKNFYSWTLEAYDRENNMVSRTSDRMTPFKVIEAAPE